MNYKELEAALTVFDITEHASLKEIKARHKALVRKYHPDTGCKDNDKIRLINEAYRLLIDYCSQYRFSFNRKEFLQQYPEERLREQFAYDPVWGGTKPEEEN
ncbi:MAG: DnaJ domain-containing protein [Desulfuromonas sp.]|nr:DnaJ domain-containing protein [Desulfuromonas sp.]